MNGELLRAVWHSGLSSTCSSHIWRDKMKLKGNPVSPGISIGRAYLYTAFSGAAAEDYFEDGQQEKYIGVFEAALVEAHRELNAVIASFTAKDANQAKIFAAHLEILDDEEILSMIRDAILKERKLPDYAISSVYDTFIEILGKAKDSTISSRTADLQDVRNRLLRILKGGKEKSLSCLPENSIVVAHDLLPSDTAMLDREHVAGVITETGGVTSHTAIIARSYKIPAVLGVQKAGQMIHEGDLLVLDAVEGGINVNPEEQVLEQAKEKADAFLKRQHEVEKYLNQPAITADGQRIEIGINIESDQFCDSSENYDFVGLFRTEFLYMESDHLPTEEEQFLAYRRVLENAKGKTVTLRTLDIGGDKALKYMQMPKEENPFLGKRALRLCFDCSDIFSTQLRAALRASAFGPLQIMFPMVGSMDDIRRAKAAVEAAKEQLRTKGVAFNEQIKLGIMIEIPSIAVIADLAAREVDFASVGTNDLTQYLCAVDRMNPEISGYYQGMGPAMLRALGFVFEQFQAQGKPVSVCGELAGNPIAAAVMVGLGLRKLSMSKANLARVKAVLAGLTVEEAKRFGEVCKNLTTENEVEEYLQKMLN